MIGCLYVHVYISVSGNECHSKSDKYHYNTADNEHFDVRHQTINIVSFESGC